MGVVCGLLPGRFGCGPWDGAKILVVLALVVITTCNTNMHPSSSRKLLCSLVTTVLRLSASFALEGGGEGLLYGGWLGVAMPALDSTPFPGVAMHVLDHTYHVQLG